MKKVLVTGCGGFIGSNLVDKLLELEIETIGLDNFSTGRREFLQSARQNKNFRLIEFDLLRDIELVEQLHGVDTVFHLAANADVRDGSQFLDRDLEQNTIVTSNVLKACHYAKVKQVIFSSTGSVYGEAKQIPTPEACDFPTQTSLYGASKLAGEGLVTAYSEAFDLKVFIFRFVSILGHRYTHGHVYDFVRQLLVNPQQLRVLGDGKQKKSYLHVDDCVSGMLQAISKCSDLVNIFNLGTPEYCQVVDSVKWICAEMEVEPELSFSGGRQGWIGDNPFIFLDTSRIQAIGWKANMSIESSIKNTVQFLLQNKWVLDKR